MVPTLTPILYVRQLLRSLAPASLPLDTGPQGALAAALGLVHPCSRPPPMHPLYARCLQCAVHEDMDIGAHRYHRFAFWQSLAKKCEGEREGWLSTLPPHCAELYGHSQFHGPFFRRIHDYLVSLGFSDVRTFSDVSRGLPSGGVLPLTGLWPTRHNAKELFSATRPSVADVMEAAPKLVREWQQHGRPDLFVDNLIDRNLDEVAAHRRCEVDIGKLVPGSFAAHTEFTVLQGATQRACNDCSSSGWNETHLSLEKLTLCSAEDPITFAAHLLARRPAARPCLAVADEKHAYRNWANSRPECMIMVVILRQCLRAWRDYALCFGDASAVYGYNRVRLMLTIFFLVEFVIPVWSYFDDSAIVDRSDLAASSWFIFLRLHALLRIPIKDSPYTHPGGYVRKDDSKLRPPAASNTYLGELVVVGRLPCRAAPTPSRIQSGNQMVQQLLAERRLFPGAAASIFGKLWFLGSELHGRVGMPALQPINAAQHASHPVWSPAIESALVWSGDLLQ